VHYGAERLGASVIPISGGNTKRQVMIHEGLRPTVLTCTPSYALHVAETAEEMGVSFRDLRFKAGIFGAEPWSERMRREIERKLNLKAMDIYGLSEVMGPGVAVECIEAQSGLHIFEDHFIPEIINPKTGEALPWGMTGELVFTTITKEASGDPLPHPGPLGPAPRTVPLRPTMVRMGRIQGRSDDMLIIRGVNVFPSQIEKRHHGDPQVRAALPTRGRTRRQPGIS